MNGEPGRGPAWASVALVLAGVVLFGAVQAEYTYLLAGLLLVASALVLLRTPPELRPSRLWVCAAAVLPLWVALQLAPLPAGVVAALSPRTATWIQEVWPGPLRGLHGEVIAGQAPSWFPISLDPIGTREFLFQVTASLALFLAAKTYFSPRPAARRRLAIAVTAFACAESVYGLGQWLSDTPHVLWVVKQFYVGAASGTLVSRNHFAIVLYLGLGCALALLTERLQRTEQVDPDRARVLAARLTLALAIGAILAGILASKSRAGLAGGALVLAYSVAFAQRRGRRTVLVASLVLLTLAAIPAVLLVAPEMTERLAQLPSEWTGAVSRGAVLRLSPDLIRAFPLFGSGAATFEILFTRLRPPDIRGLYDHAHNDYLEILIECGVIGLLLALTPVALYAVELLRDFRRRRGGDPDAGSGALDPAGPPAWPIYAALGFLALHEFVDFGLQIPALAYLVALLAGAFAPPPRPAAGGGRRPAIVFAVAALALALPAAAHSAARWPAVKDAVSIPDLPDVRADRARRSFNAWQQKKKDPALIQQALSEEARAQVLRPFFARYPLNHAQYAASALGAEAADAKAEDALRGDIERVARHARTLDPWNGWNRSRLMNVALFLGNLDDAVADARVATQQSPEVTQDVIRTFTKFGLPTSSLAEIVARTPETFGTLLGALLEEKDYASAGKLVPPDAKPSFMFCQSGWAVRETLKNAHHAPAEKLLQGCLDVPEVKQSQPLEETIKFWLATDALDRNDVARAESWVRRMRPGSLRSAKEIDLAERRRDWRGVIRWSRELLDGPEPPDAPEAEGWTRYRLGVAYAQEGQLDLALREFRKVQQLEVDLGDVDKIIRQLQLGENPFRN